jgi:hypothetical protein
MQVLKLSMVNMACGEHKMITPMEILQRFVHTLVAVAQEATISGRSLRMVFIQMRDPVSFVVFLKQVGKIAPVATTRTECDTTSVLPT